MKEITSTIRNYSLGFVLLGCIGSMSCTREADFDMEGAGTEEVAFSAAIGQASRRGDNAWTGGELVGMKVGDETRTYFVSDATTGAMSTDGEPYTWAAESGNYELHAWSPLTAESIALTDQSDADKMLQSVTIDMMLGTFVEKKEENSMLGLVSLRDAYAPSLDDIVAYRLDATGVLRRYENLLREFGKQEG